MMIFANSLNNRHLFMALTNLSFGHSFTRFSHGAVAALDGLVSGGSFLYAAFNHSGVMIVEAATIIMTDV